MSDRFPPQSALAFYANGQEQASIDSYHAQLDELRQSFQQCERDDISTEIWSRRLSRIFGALVVVAAFLFVLAIGFAIQHAQG